MQAEPGRQTLVSAAEAGRALLERIDRREGAAVIRLGDGEGVLLGGPANGDPALDEYLTTHFGPHPDASDREALRTRLNRAIARADIIGVRQDVLDVPVPPGIDDMSPEQRIAAARRHLSLRPEEHESLDAGSAHRLLLLARWLGTRPFRDATLLTSAWCHFDWLESGFLARLARSQGHVGLVTGRDELAGAFRRHGIEVDLWSVPLRYLRRDSAWRPHFPDRYETLLDTLEPSFAGQVFFVGAGICGKVYCDLLARRGAIAIDIGAVCDAWLGIATRPRVAFSRWGQEAVPDHLSLDRQLTEGSGDPDAACMP